MALGIPPVPLQHPLLLGSALAKPLLALRRRPKTRRERRPKESRQSRSGRSERNKRKHVTEISGLEHFNIDLKKAAKEFGKKFATGSSVTKTASGGEEITVQGDVSDEVLEWVTEKYDVPEENVEQIEDKKKEKKAAPPMVAPQPT
jgi:density-regulated protein DRP1